MAFGSKQAAVANKGTGDGEKQNFVSPWMPRNSGVRKWRYLPVVEHGEIVLTNRINPSTGNALHEGNKKTGKVLQGPVAVEETPFIGIWWPVMVDGTLKPRRLITDINRQWTNPFWKWVSERFEKGSAERKAQKLLFAVNVYDITPIVTNADGQLFYPDERGNYTLLADGAGGHIITDKEKLPTQGKEEAQPLNKIRIFEGSYGQPNGRHLFQQIADLYDTVEDQDGMIRRLPEMELKLVTKGSGINTVYSISNGTRFTDFPKDVALLPRYDLDSWLKPWPDQAILDLLEGEDFKQVVDSYGIQLYPTLAEGIAESEDTGFDFD